MHGSFMTSHYSAHRVHKFHKRWLANWSINFHLPWFRSLMVLVFPFAFFLEILIQSWRTLKLRIILFKVFTEQERAWISLGGNCLDLYIRSIALNSLCQWNLKFVLNIVCAVSYAYTLFKWEFVGLKESDSCPMPKYGYTSSHI